ncbi:caspase domain-containing protein [Sphingomonas sp. PP-F2F-A104-K0414]|uniref:caspase family protein n=1 Tax=Sphingomonas sp. PP-F2F-A104-K0414 TaxID=2135661 RepID=UPI00105382EE|nr:caspase family protein [Sphingomonas sp. PP-F2F-A104-K0414]TCP97384.1 caspase domain-containing protein [Sphingomonas sp. PP-F2F-A104-K0414]
MTRKALVIGNGKYPIGYDLLNPVNDAVAIAEALRRNGFEVTELTDVDHNEMEIATVAFGKSLERDGAAAFYFAGHGVEIDGVNHLVGIDADPTNETSTKYNSLRLDFIVDAMDRAGSETNIVILDACRENPFGKKWARSFGAGGLAPVTAPRGTLIAFSTSPGEKAMDGEGSHGRYTEALLQHIDAVCPVETMFKRVRATMATTTGKKQTPWEHTSLIAEFFLNRSRHVPITQYSDQAVKDGGFIADPKKPSHLVIAELKYRHYDRQNTAARGLSVSALNKFSDSSCFMIGRALYAAADGDAHAAKGWIASFVGNAAKVNPGKRKALLDGMLFEVFFDSQGTLRAKPKGKHFDSLYAMVDVPALRPSLEFIAEVLVSTGRMFLAFPNLDDDVSIDVTTSIMPGKPNPAVTGIMVGGRDILKLDSPDRLDDKGVPLYFIISLGELKRRLAADAALPTSRQVLNFPDLSKPPEELRYPAGYSLAWSG